MRSVEGDEVRRRVAEMNSDPELGNDGIVRGGSSLVELDGVVTPVTSDLPVSVTVLPGPGLAFP